MLESAMLLSQGLFSWAAGRTIVCEAAAAISGYHFTSLEEVYSKMSWTRSGTFADNTPLKTSWKVAGVCSEQQMQPAVGTRRLGDDTVTLSEGASAAHAKAVRLLEEALRHGRDPDAPEARYDERQLGIFQDWLDVLGPPHANSTGPMHPRRLSIGEDFDTVDQLRAAAVLIGDRVQAFLADIARARGGGSLDGAEFKYKGAESAYRKFLEDCTPAEELKMADDGKSALTPYKEHVFQKSAKSADQYKERSTAECDKIPLCMSDLLRFTILTPDSDAYKTVATGVRNSLDQQGAKTANLKNYWVEGNNYLGINDVYRWPIPLVAIGCTAQIKLASWSKNTAGGEVGEARCKDNSPILHRGADGMYYYWLRVEVQHHTVCSFNIKQDVTHSMYEIIRKAASHESCEVAKAKADQGLFINWLWYAAAAQSLVPRPPASVAAWRAPGRMGPCMRMPCAVLRALSDSSSCPGPAHAQLVRCPCPWSHAKRPSRRSGA